MRDRYRLEYLGKKLHKKDERILTTIQEILFQELAFALQISTEAVNDRITAYINEVEN